MDEQQSAYGSDRVWQVFADAVLTIEVRGVGLTVGVDPLPWDAPVHAVTGWNPGEERSRDENDAANARLEAELHDAGIEHHAAIGAAPDGTWSEPGFVLVGLARADAVAIGRRYGQLAVYEVRDGALLVVPCAPG